MDHIDKYKRVEEDQQQGKGRAKLVLQDRRDFRSGRYNNNWHRRGFAGQSGSIATQVVSTVFREPVHQVLEKIKNEPYFKWPNKMGGDPTKCNKSLHCQYQQERGHHRREQNFMKSFGAAGQKWKIEVISISAQWVRRPGRLGIAERYFFKATFRHNQCYSHCSGKDRFLSL